MSEVKLKPTTSELAASIKKEIKIDPKTGVGTIRPDFYASTLPEGITPELITQLQDHNTQLAAAAGLAFGQEAESTMKHHKDLDRATLDLVTVGKDGFDFTYDRSKQVTVADPKGGESTTKTIHGVLRVGYRTYGTKNRGELGKVKTLLAEDAAKAFGG